MSKKPKKRRQGKPAHKPCREPRNDTFLARDPVDLSDKGRCSRCGGCCSSILPLSDQEIRDLRAHAEKTGFVPKLPDGDDVIYMHCPFLQKPDGGKPGACMAYDARPAVCRTFSCHNTTKGNAKAWMDAYGETPLPDPRNAWEVFNLTGMRAGGEEIPYDMAPVCRIQDDQGGEYEFHVGRPASFLLTGGRNVRAAMIIGLFQNGLQVFDQELGKLAFYEFAEMTEILSRDCIVTPPGEQHGRHEKEDKDA